MSEDLKREITHLREQLISERRKNELLRADMSELKSGAMRLRSKVASMLDHSDKPDGKESQKLAEAESRIQELEEENLELAINLEESEQKTKLALNKALKTAEGASFEDGIKQAFQWTKPLLMDSLKASVALFTAFEEKRAFYLDELSDKQEAYTELSGKLSSTVSELEETRQALSMQDEVLYRTRQQVLELEAKLSMMEEQLSSVREQAGDHSHDVDMRDEALAGVKEQLSRMEQRSQTLENQLGLCESRLSESVSEMLAKESLLKTSQEDVGSTNDRLSGLQSDYDSIIHEKEGLEQSLEELTRPENEPEMDEGSQFAWKVRQRVEDHRQSFVRRNDSLELQVRDLKRESAQLRKSVAEYIKQVSILEGKLAEANSRLEYSSSVIDPAIKR